MATRIRIDTALVLRKLVESRQEAQECIEKGYVTVNGEVVTKTHRLVSDSDSIIVNIRRKYVSRGGDKLEGILHDVYGDDVAIRSHLTGVSALDIGSSTGGFTDCLLKYGARDIDAVDVGTSQLHEILKADSRVRSFETTDIRDFHPMKQYSIIVVDLSFISLTNVFEDVMAFVGRETELFLLVKPQFEVGREHLKKGIVRDEHIRQLALDNLLDIVKNTNVKEVLSFQSVLEGGDGNQEYFIYAKF